jgi:hypothetical protein
MALVATHAVPALPPNTTRVNTVNTVNTAKVADLAAGANNQITLSNHTWEFFMKRAADSDNNLEARDAPDCSSDGKDGSSGGC